MDLPLDTKLTVGVQTIHRRSEPAEDAWLPDARDGRAFVELVDRLGFDSIWCGDHIAFAIPILDPIVQLAQAATYSDRLTIGTCVYLLPLRHPGPVAKQIATLDLLSGGRLIFGIGVGGEFQSDFDVSGIPVGERGARLTESIEVLRALWRGEPASYAGRHFAFDDITMLPAPHQPGGPPIWCGGRQDAALRRAGRMADGYLSYVITPERFQRSLETIAPAYADGGRSGCPFGTGHLLFARLDKDYETALNVATHHLSIRYAMDFREAARKYCALGSAADVAADIVKFYDAGCRTIVFDLIGPYEERIEHVEAVASELLPLLAS
ncbi:MAG: TIGR03619 family F420-dependent LLM class oxidoreductase, partial [Proteobacteria bacterium]|nr:TIGR03619 family F420-dependent LLM class oxidoreductase [Pseudomonadota bacterium]